MKKMNNSYLTAASKIVRQFPFLLLFVFVIFQSACSKQVGYEDELSDRDQTFPSASKKNNETSQSLLTSIDFQWDNQPEVSPFELWKASYENNKMSRMVWFSMGDGSVRSIRNYFYDQMGRLIRTEIEGEGFTEYTYDRKSKTIRSGNTYDPYRTFKFKVVYNTNENDKSLTADRYNSRNIHEERMVLYYNSMGAPKLVEYFKPNENGSLELMGRKVMTTTATTEEIKSWISTASMFPEPICPPLIQMLICDQIRMEGNYISASGEDTLVNGRTDEIERRDSSNTNDLRGKLLRITIKDGGDYAPPYNLYLNYAN